MFFRDMYGKKGVDDMPDTTCSRQKKKPKGFGKPICSPGF